jgi:hypothetical protein
MNPKKFGRCGLAPRKSARIKGSSPRGSLVEIETATASPASRECLNHYFVGEVESQAPYECAV